MARPRAPTLRRPRGRNSMARYTSVTWAVLGSQKLFYIKVVSFQNALSRYLCFWFCSFCVMIVLITPE